MQKDDDESDEEVKMDKFNAPNKKNAGTDQCQRELLFNQTIF